MPPGTPPGPIEEKRAWCEDHERLVLSPDRQPWERQPGESLLWFRRFIPYLEYGPDRTITQLWREYGTEKNRHQPPYHTWYRACYQYRWNERGLAWDDELFKQKHQAEVDAVRDMAARHARYTSEIQEALVQPMLAALKMLKDNPEQFRKDMEAMGMVELYQAITRAANSMPGIIKAERVARGVTSDQVSVDLEGEVGHNVVIYLPENGRGSL